MKYLYLSLVLLIITGCTTVNKSIVENQTVDKNQTLIENIERVNFAPSVLIPDYDFKDLRIDIIRQTEDDGDCVSSDVDYHSIGLNLGNGLFMDFNDNLSLLVPELLDIKNNEQFILKKINPSIFSDYVITYESSENEFTTQSEGLFNTTTKKLIEKNDSSVNVEEGLFSEYKILKTDTSITYQSKFSNRVINKTNEGYSYNSMFGVKEYKQIDNDINIRNRYIIRNQGDMIEIYTNGIFKKEYLRYRIVKAANRIHVFNNFRQVLEIVKADNELAVFNNRRKLYSYVML